LSGAFEAQELIGTVIGPIQTHGMTAHSDIRLEAHERMIFNVHAVREKVPHQGRMARQDMTIFTVDVVAALYFLASREANDLIDSLKS
jgi:hypothetical protein